MSRPLLSTSAALLLLAGCPADYEPVELPVKTAGALQVGAAESVLELPIGCPEGGYTFRAKVLGNTANVDYRDSDYTVGFAPSTGVQTPPTIKAFWFDNGQENLVTLEVDVIYAYDDLLREITERLSAETGLDMTGRVALSTNHSHNSPGNFTAQVTYYLGGDRYNHEVFTRYAEQAVAEALEAWEGRQEAAVGVAHFHDWDPTDYIYRDRRGENDDLQVFDDIPAGRRKDHLWMMRVDTAAGEPMAVLYGFGMHGTLGDADNTLLSSDAPGHIDFGFAEQFDTPVIVAHFQGSVGDASPAGEDDWFARHESIGERAGAMLYEAWEQVPTSTVSVTMETQTRSVRQHRDDIHVTRNGAVDWTYLPFDEDYEPDLIIYGDDGEILSPLDEFNAEFGAAFCGEDSPYLATWDINAEVYPYSSCTQPEGFMTLLENAFDLDDEPELPLAESLETVVTASTFGPLPTLMPDGSQQDADLLWTFWPGEVTNYFNEMVRRRAEAELGFVSTIVTGVSQDHEGYLLLTEDWLEGGYEPNINLWGPLQADWIMDQAMLMNQALTTPEIELQNPDGIWDFYPWGPWELPEINPDPTPDAGTIITEAPEYLYCPLFSEDEQQDEGMNPDLTWQEYVPRVQGLVSLAWQGGDPAVDFPRVVLEMNDGGTWVEATTHAGRPVDSTLPDFIIAHTPHPLDPAEAEQTHSYWVGWQPVSHVVDRAGLPLGEYRLHVYGQRATGGVSWPFETEPYEITSDPFEVIGATIEVEASETDLWLSLPGHERGFRLIGLEGSRNGDNPLPEHTATFSWSLDDGSSLEEELVGVSDGAGRSWFGGAIPAGATAVVVTDIYGNTGELRL